RQALLQPLGQRLAHRATEQNLAELFGQQVERQQRAGHYPPEPVGPIIRLQLLERIPDALTTYQALLTRYPHPLPVTPRVLHDTGIPLDNTTLKLEDSLSHLHSAPPPAARREAHKVARLVWRPSQIKQGEKLYSSTITRH